MSLHYPHHVSSSNAVHKTARSCALRFFSRFMHKSHFLLLSLLLLTTGTLFAQQGFGTNNPNPQSVIHLEGVNQGLLIPDVSLTSATVFLGGATATAAHVSMLVYNTNAATTTTGGTANGLSGAGYYYWNGTAWVRLTTTAAAGGGINLWDTDTDTGIQLEETGDEDIIRFDTDGNQRMSIAKDGEVMFGPITKSYTSNTVTYNPTGSYGTVANANQKSIDLSQVIFDTTNFSADINARTFNFPITNTNTKGVVLHANATHVIGNIQSSYWIYLVDDNKVKFISLEFQLSGGNLQARYTSTWTKTATNQVPPSSQNHNFFVNGTNTHETHQIASISVDVSPELYATINSTSGDAFFKGSLSDSSHDAGTAGQILTSTGEGTNWVPSIPTTSITGGTGDGQVLTTTITGGTTTVGWKAVQGDNLGDHTATQDIKLGAFGITDSDGNTQIQVEEANNDNTIRFDTDGERRISIFDDGVVVFGQSGTATKTTEAEVTIALAKNSGTHVVVPNTPGSFDKKLPYNLTKIVFSGITYDLPFTNTNEQGIFPGSNTTPLVGNLLAEYWVYNTSGTTTSASKLVFSLSATNQLMVWFEKSRTRRWLGIFKEQRNHAFFNNDLNWHQTFDPGSLPAPITTVGISRASDINTLIDSTTGDAQFAGDVEIAGDLEVTGVFKDSSGDEGVSGQVLLSTEVGTNWTDVKASGFIGSAGLGVTLGPLSVRVAESFTARSIEIHSTNEMKIRGIGKSMNAKTDGSADVAHTKKADETIVANTWTKWDTSLHLALEGSMQVLHFSDTQSNVGYRITLIIGEDMTSMGATSHTNLVTIERL